MLSTRKLLIRILIIAFICLPGMSGSGQVIQVLDTSDYLPVYYEDALDNNLMVAAAKGYDTEIERLLRKGAHVDAETYEGATPLVFAVANNHLTSVNLLLSQDPILDKLTSNNETPLIIAVRNRNAEIAEALIRSGANIDYADKNGATPLHYATLAGSFDIVDLLLYYDADCNRKANDGTTPLMAAVWAGFQDIADLLMQNGANLEARDKEGFTPFLIAAQAGDTLIMNILIEEGVDIYEMNNYNYNALSLAIESNQKAVVELLLKKGNKWSSSDYNAVNPYRVASSFGRKDIIELLEQHNINGKQGLKIDEVSLTLSAKVNLRDYFTGMSVSFREPLLSGGFLAGCDVKPTYTRVLLKEGENTYYQYYDRSTIIYGGVFKDFTIEEYSNSLKLSIITSLSAGYCIANKFKGTNLTSENKFKIMPSAGIKLDKKWFTFKTEIEYMNSGFYRIGPLWLRIGFSYNYFLSKVRTPGKTIKWY